MSYLVPGSCFIRGCVQSNSLPSLADRVEPVAYGFLVLMTLELDIGWNFFSFLLFLFCFTTLFVCDALCFQVLSRILNPLIYKSITIHHSSHNCLYSFIPVHGRHLGCCICVFFYFFLARRDSFLFLL